MKNRHLRLIPRERPFQSKNPLKALRFLTAEAQELCIALSQTLSRFTRRDKTSCDSFIAGELIALRDSWGISFRDVSAKIVWGKLHGLIPERHGSRFDLKPNGMPNIVHCKCPMGIIELAFVYERNKEERGHFYLARDGSVQGMCVSCIERDRAIAKRKRLLGRDVQLPHLVSFVRADLHRHIELRRARVRRNRKKSIRQESAPPHTLHLRRFTIVP